MPTFSGGSCKKIWALAAFESDTVDLATPTRAIFVTVAGNIVITLIDDTDETSVTIPVSANAIYPLNIKRLWSTGTTATLFGLQ